MESYIFNDLDFTGRAWNDFYDTVGGIDFQDREEKAIYGVLKNTFKRIDFSDYLKRYIYHKAGIEGEYADVPFEEFRDTLIAIFKDNNTPASFDSAATKLSAAAKNWLTRASVSRKTVLLLGFGLAMTVDEVNTFLTKGLCEQKLNPKDPFEVVCRYCYANRLGYYGFQNLMYEYKQLAPCIHYASRDEQTGGFYKSVQQLETKKELLEYLSSLKDICGVSRYSRTAKRKFTELYTEARRLVANGHFEGDGDILLENVSAADVERTIFAGVPKTEKNRNLQCERDSSLSDVLYGKRLSRSRIGRILGKSEGEQETEVSRFDLITLNFFIFSQRLDKYPRSRSLFNAFYEDTNRILSECFMHELIIQNPYENFVLTCMLAEDPLDAFSGVWERSYLEE